MQTKMGGVQGSISGPTLWNILLDPLLKEVSEMGVHCQAFANDVVLIVSVDASLEIQGKANSVLAHA